MERITGEGGEMTDEVLTEDYYTLAEIRLAVDLDILEYGSCNQRLTAIRHLIDRKRPELKPNQIVSTPKGATTK